MCVCVLQQHTGQEVKWVDGGRPLLKVTTQLVSTVYTQVWSVHHLHISDQNFYIVIRSKMWYEALIVFYFCIFSLQDQHLHNFFHHCQSIESTGQSGGELIKYLKVLVICPSWGCLRPGGVCSVQSALAGISHPEITDLSFSSSVESACHGGSCDGEVPPYHSEPAVSDAHHLRSGWCCCERHQVWAEQLSPAVVSVTVLF